MNYPEINGKPAVLVTVHVEDKINIGDYQNVTHGATVSRFVEDDDSVIVETYNHLSEQVLEPELGRQRVETLENLKRK